MFTILVVSENQEQNNLSLGQLGFSKSIQILIINYLYLILMDVYGVSDSSHEWTI